MCVCVCVNTHVCVCVCVCEQCGNLKQGKNMLPLCVCVCVCVTFFCGFEIVTCSCKICVPLCILCQQYH